MKWHSDHLKPHLKFKKKPDIFDSHFYVVKRDSRNAVDKLYGLTYKYVLNNDFYEIIN
jgi:hypothetical protein